MPIQTAIWRVDPQPEQLVTSSLAKEQVLEEMIVGAPTLLSEEWMLIGRQVDTGLGGRIDLLAIAPDGSLVLIELKRHQTPRDVVAQTLDYASWVEGLRPDQIDAIYRRWKPGHSLANDFNERFKADLDDEMLNQRHQLVIVASSLDESTERIVQYLSKRDMSINVLFFQVFTHGNQQLLSRTWLIDPAQTQINAAASTTNTGEPWNGEFYCSFGEGESRSWEEARKFGFVSGGGGSWYSRTLRLLNVGDRIWVKVPDVGFVGVGRVVGSAQPAASFKLQTPTGEFSALDVLKDGTYHRELVNDLERCEYFVPIKWLQAVPLNQAVRGIGLFGNQNTVCKPTVQKWRSTVERLKQTFVGFDQEIAQL